MKSAVFFFSIFFALVLSVAVFAQEAELEKSELEEAEFGEANPETVPAETALEEPAQQDVAQQEDEPAPFDWDQHEWAQAWNNPEPAQKPAKPKNPNPPYVTFNEGIAASWLTRIINQTERSNFVFEDFLAGLYFETYLHNIKYITPTARLALYYPLEAKFNKFPQLPKNPFRFGADLNLGGYFNLLNYRYFRLNLGPAVHLFFFKADRWNYLDLGITALLGMEVPLFERWTFLVGGVASLDNGNLGGNQLMEPFDLAYQYQISIGVRYSKKQANKAYVFEKRRKKSDEEKRPFIRR